MIEKLTIKEFLALGDLPANTAIWDVRDADKFRAGHIARAVNRPVDEIDGRAFLGLDEIYVLCGGGTKAERAIERLVTLGFQGRLVHLTDGTRGAMAMGVPLVVES